MTRFYLPFVGLLHMVLMPLAILGDLVLTATCRFLDLLMPFDHVVTINGPAPRPTREVRFLQTGVHRMAQPKLMRVSDDDDGSDDGSDEVRQHLNC